MAGFTDPVHGHVGRDELGVATVGWEVLLDDGPLRLFVTYG